MVRTQEELLKSVNDMATEENKEAITALMEDIADTIDSRSEDWKTKYEESEKNWEKRYRERFLSGGEETDRKESLDPPDTKPRYKTFEELFKVEEV